VVCTAREPPAEMTRNLLVRDHPTLHSAGAIGEGRRTAWRAFWRAAGLLPIQQVAGERRLPSTCCYLPRKWVTAVVHQEPSRFLHRRTRLRGLARILGGMSQPSNLQADRPRISFLPGLFQRRISFRAAFLQVLALCLLLAAGSLAVADELPEEYSACPVASAEQARTVGDLLFEQGAYQRAASCYQAASEYALADKAFLKALEPASAVTARRVSEQSEQTKTMWRSVARAFRTDH